jgi:uncharacterized protein YecE (DUF72 family)
MARVWIGTSGYVYPHWRKGVFYPEGLRARDELTYYAGIFHTVELNNPFYRLPTVAMFERWRDSTPEDFLFAVKVSRFISHVKRLLDVDEPLAEFVRLASILGSKLGPLLVQLPPNLHFDPPRLEAFLRVLPARHRWVIEVRHPSWQNPQTYEALARRSVALCVPIGGLIQPDLVTTAPFTYIRVHRGIEGKGYMGKKGLRPWASRVRALARAGKDIYFYFNNDLEGHAVRDGMLLREMLKRGLRYRPS